MISYVVLFLSALIAATLVPMQSEAVLVGLLIAADKPLVWLLVVATTGNVLGAVINWYLGHVLVQFQDRAWFPASETQLLRAKNWYGRYGRWSLLGSWLPVVGDPVTVIAGALGERLFPFVLMVTLAKGARYLFLALITVPWL
jgi:membrane protein YqaA with SNARE-associated domain